MTRDQYYELLKEAHDNTDWNNLQSVRAYNEYARRLRSQMEWEEQYNGK